MLVRSRNRHEGLGVLHAGGQAGRVGFVVRPDGDVVAVQPAKQGSVRRVSNQSSRMWTFMRGSRCCAGASPCRARADARCAPAPRVRSASRPGRARSPPSQRPGTSPAGMLQRQRRGVGGGRTGPRPRSRGQDAGGEALRAGHGHRRMRRPRHEVARRDRAPSRGGASRPNLGVTEAETSPIPIAAPASMRTASIAAKKSRSRVQRGHALVSRQAESVGARDHHRHGDVHAGDLDTVEPVDQVAGRQKSPPSPPRRCP